MAIPTHAELFNPLLDALRKLGGSASIAEVNQAVLDDLSLTPEEIAQLHKGGPGTEVAYRLAWARSYLKVYGLVENSRRGVWSLTPTGLSVNRVDPREVNRVVRGKPATRPAPGDDLDNVFVGSTDGAEPEVGWQEELLDALFALSPASFERLAQRLLRESGFTQVEVTGRSGDGGIDGAGILQFGGLVSFRVLFQCKRYRGSVGAGVIRDFRGAMIGRAERGLVITTGAFTQDAKAEATRDGAPLIDLVDGEALLAKLKDLGLGVKVRTRTVEDVSVLREFFEAI